MNFVPSTVERLTTFYGKPPQYSSRGFALLDGEEVIAVFGVQHVSGTLVLFCDVKPEARQERPAVWLRRVIVSGVRKAMTLVSGTKAPVFAWADPQCEGSDALLERMGFEHLSQRVYIHRESA